MKRPILSLLCLSLALSLTAAQAATPLESKLDRERTKSA